jgi:hypothetical protein
LRQKLSKRDIRKLAIGSTEIIYGATSRRSTIEAMPRGQSEKRPADVIGNAVRIIRIATGEEEEQDVPQIKLTERTRVELEDA